ncbi:MAG: sigma-70 family RNA polymerase sigma factor [Armatimonadia bacterium]
MVPSAYARAGAYSRSLQPDAAAQDDVYLVKAAQEGDALAFSALVDKYHSKVFGIVYRMCGPGEAEDLTQDIFLRALTALRKFQFQGESSYRTWLYRIAVNACINELRRRKRRYQIEGPSLDEMVETNSGLMERSIPDFSRMPHDVAERRELQQLVQAVIQTLSPHHRAVIALIDLEGVEYEEAARIIGCPLGTLKSRLARARQAFGRRLRRYVEKPASN